MSETEKREKRDKVREQGNLKTLYLLGLTGPEGLSQQLHRSRRIHKPASGTHHEGKQTAQLLHESYVPLVLLTRARSQTPVSLHTAVHVSVDEWKICKLMCF